MSVKSRTQGLLYLSVFVFFVSLFFFLPPLPLPAQQSEELFILPAEQYAHTERENMRVYIQNRYSGLQYRQRRVYLQRSGISAGEAVYTGSVYLVKTLSRDSVKILQPVDRELQVECKLTPLGMVAAGPGPLPMRTGFPVLPMKEIKLGDSWQADGKDSVYLQETGHVPAPFHCSYTYQGESSVMERPARTIDFEFSYYDASPYARDNHEIRGRGEGQIAIFTDKRGGFFIKERLIRHYLSSGGEVERREEGFRLTWGRGISQEDLDAVEEKLVQGLRERGDDDIEFAQKNEKEGPEEADDGRQKRTVISSEDGSGDIEVEQTTEGIKLNLPEIHFYPDQARILPREKSRLDRLADMLKSVEESDFLIVGHTADVGTKESQYELSLERAKTILEEMTARGLSADRFIYQGIGGDEPVASNDTEEGRAQNRRVEVIILNQ